MPQTSINTHIYSVSKPTHSSVHFQINQRTKRCFASFCFISHRLVVLININSKSIISTISIKTCKKKKKQKIIIMNNEQWSRAHARAHTHTYIHTRSTKYTLTIDICCFICGSEIGTYCYLLIYQVSLFLSPIGSVDEPPLSCVCVRVLLYSLNRSPPSIC